MDLPLQPDLQPISSLVTLAKYDEQWDAPLMSGSCDATWASAKLKRRSMSGVVMMLAGAAIYYQIRLQPTAAMSLIEVELVSMADAGKAALYIRWILEELGILQLKPTLILADNAAAIKMANVGQPTQQTRHIDAKHFVILQWCDDEFISFLETKSESNHIDTLTKITKRNKFNEHTDIFMGRRKLAYTITGKLPPISKEPHRKNIINYISCSTWQDQNF